jgi:hypothetical protein
MPKIKFYTRQFGKSRKFLRELNVLEIPQCRDKISINHKKYIVDSVIQAGDHLEILVTKIRKFKFLSFMSFLFFWLTVYF